MQVPNAVLQLGNENGELKQHYDYLNGNVIKSICSCKTQPDINIHAIV